MTSPPLATWARRCSLAVVALALLCSALVTFTDAGPAAAAVRAAAVSKGSTGAPVPSSGCHAAPTAAVTNQRQNIEIDGVARWYLLTTPSPSTPSRVSSEKSSPATKGAAIPRPMVVDFHGLSEGASLHSATSQFGNLGQKDGFVAVFPEGTGSPVQWNTGSEAPTNADLAFVTSLLQQVESAQCIDTSRVYASGFSDGSFMVSLLACTMSNRFAAIGAVSGLQLPTPCHTTRPVPIITFHGTADPILYFNGGVGTGLLKTLLGGGNSGSTTTSTTVPAKLHGPGVPATVRAWAVKDGCNPKAVDHKVASRIILRTYACPAKTSVQFYIIIGGGHAWPGSRVSQSIAHLTGFTTFQIRATPTEWSFFQRFQL